MHDHVQLTTIPEVVCSWSIRFIQWSPSKLQVMTKAQITVTMIHALLHLNIIGSGERIAWRQGQHCSRKILGACVENADNIYYAYHLV